MFKRKNKNWHTNKYNQTLDEVFLASSGLYSLVKALGSPRFDQNTETASVSFERNPDHDTDVPKIVFNLNPDLFKKLPPEQVAFLISHESLHVAKKHLQEHKHQDKYPNPRILNMAHEMLINDTLSGSYNMTPPMNPNTPSGEEPERMGVFGDEVEFNFDGWETPQAYPKLVELLKKKQEEKQQQGEPQDGESENSKNSETGNTEENNSNSQDNDSEETPENTSEDNTQGDESQENPEDTENGEDTNTDNTGNNEGDDTTEDGDGTSADADPNNTDTEEPEGDPQDNGTNGEGEAADGETPKDDTDPNSEGDSNGEEEDNLDDLINDILNNQAGTCSRTPNNNGEDSQEPTNENNTNNNGDSDGAEGAEPEFSDDAIQEAITEWLQEALQDAMNNNTIDEALADIINEATSDGTLDENMVSGTGFTIGSPTGKTRGTDDVNIPNMSLDWARLLKEIDPRILTVGRKTLAFDNTEQRSFARVYRPLATFYPDVIIPGHIGEDGTPDGDAAAVPTIILALDYSGSTPEWFLQVIVALADTIPTEGADVRVITWSNDVVEWDENRNVCEQWGTDIDLVFEYAKTVSEEIDGDPYVIVVSDGEFNHVPSYHDLGAPTENYYWVGIERSDKSSFEHNLEDDHMERYYDLGDLTDMSEYENWSRW